ncbi:MULTISPECIES: hypothetical protein [Burkholderia]|uniref:hypothetical protein n=1 Tax=Burkholderia TaxID=32008 RepID=UPI000B187938|nr:MULTISPECIES: hypothetical protein [Burkholderia]QRR12038.1 hypothetical protein GJG85_00905 [Burkholderia sp. MS389]QVN12169.1 hypothetical protein JYG37_02900 [Burkholderia sp. LAS2]
MTRQSRKHEQITKGEPKIWGALLLDRSDLQFSNVVRKLALLIILVWMGDGFVMANDFSNSVMKPGAFSLSWSGGLEYGSREMTFDGEGRFYFAKGDTINDEAQTGVGVFVLSLQNKDAQQLKDVAHTLCDKDIQSGGPETHDPAATFSVICQDEGKAVRRSGSLRLIPERFRRQVFDAPLRLSEQARSGGRKIIKLDFETVSIEHKGDHYIVSVRFINSGDRWIKFKTPDLLPGNTRGGGLSIAPFSELGRMQPRDDWGFNLAGKTLINKNEFRDGFVMLNPGEGRVLRVEAVPDNKISKGVYELSGVTFMKIEYEGYGWGLSTHVDFSPIKSQITFDRDYPSTPQEREQWETTHRANMSYHAVKPGDTFAEDGLYRAVRLNAGGSYRSLQVMPFKAGDIATTDSVRMPMESGDGVHLNGLVQWVWEGSAPTPTKPFSSAYVEGTEQFSLPGAACPRGGRWVARVRTNADYSTPEYRYDLSRIVTMRRGQPMPSISNDAGNAEWEWVGG